MSAPWRCEPVIGRPGLVAVLRQWESVEAGDSPAAGLWHAETALLLSALLPAIGRDAALPPLGGGDGGRVAILAVYGGQGSQVVGWLRQYEPDVVQALHLVEYLARTPAALAAILEAAGWSAIGQVGRVLGRRMLG